jgi:hypothetical protein
LEESYDRLEHPGKGLEYGTDGVCGGLRVRNQIKQRKAHKQEDDYPLDPLHVGLFILPVFPADYSNTPPHVQARACMFFFLPDTSKDWEQARRQRSRRRPNRFRSCV